MSSLAQGYRLKWTTQFWFLSYMLITDQDPAKSAHNAECMTTSGPFERRFPKKNESNQEVVTLNVVLSVNDGRSFGPIAYPP